MLYRGIATNLARAVEWAVNVLPNAQNSAVAALAVLPMTTERSAR